MLHLCGIAVDRRHVGREVDQEASQLFKASRGRDPEAAELAALRQRWIDNEVLYREGLSLRVNEGDTAIRERVIFKALSVIDAGVKLPKIDAAGLRGWFEQHRDRYDEPARFDFDEGVLAGERTDGVVRTFVQGLNAGNPGDVQADLRVFTARPRDNIVQSYGPEFATALAATPVGEWQVLPSKDGPRVMRLKSMTPAKPAVFEEVSGAVMQDWTDFVMAAQRSTAVRALARKYKVTIAEPAR